MYDSRANTKFQQQPYDNYASHILAWGLFKVQSSPPSKALSPSYIEIPALESSLYTSQS